MPTRWEIRRRLKEKFYPKSDPPSPSTAVSNGSLLSVAQATPPASISLRNLSRTSLPTPQPSPSTLPNCGAPSAHSQATSPALQQTSSSPPSTPLASLWEKARSIAKERLSEKESRVLDSSTTNSVASVIDAAKDGQKAAKEKQWSYIDKHGKKIHVAERFGRILKALERYASVVDVAIQHHPDTVALVWGALRFMLQVGAPSRREWDLKMARSPSIGSIQSRAWKRQWRGAHPEDGRLRVLRVHICRVLAGNPRFR